MASLRINTPDKIEFQNVRPNIPADSLPYMAAELGEWEMGEIVETGIVIDSGGSDRYVPILSATDARKLAKWLSKAADTIEGLAENNGKKHKKRSYYEEDDEPDYKF